MKASEVMIGDKIVAEDGSVLKVHGVAKLGGFRMGLTGYPDKAAIQLRHNKGDTLCHPDEVVTPA